MERFAQAFGLLVNKAKSEVWFSPNTPKTVRKELAEHLGIKLVQRLGRYLGTFIDDLSRRKEIIQEIVTKVNKNCKDRSQRHCLK